MSRGVILQVSGDPSAVAREVAGALEAAGWRVDREDPMRLTAERGSLERTVLLGAFAGRTLHLRVHLAVAAVAEGAELRWEWDRAAGMLGGAVGRARAVRHHLEAVQQLAEQLRAQGHAVAQREI